MRWSKTARAPLLIAAGLLCVTARAAKPEGPLIVGPDPGWPRFRELAETEMRTRAIDPESVRITWLGSYYKGTYKPLFSRTLQGYVGCGTINAKNRMGGYVGAQPFIVIIDYDQVLHAEADGPGGLPDVVCQKALQEGSVRPLQPEATAAVSASSDSMPDLTSAARGLTLKAMPEGAYVSAVTPGGIASTWGLRAGMVIATVNAIPLAGMGDAMLKVVDAARPGTTLGLVAGGTITLGSMR